MVACCRRLDLSGNALYGTVPAQLIAFMTKLTHLNLSHNEFIGTVPSSLTLLRSVLCSAPPQWPVTASLTDMCHTWLAWAESWTCPLIS
jgi:hypothetical protein